MRWQELVCYRREGSRPWAGPCRGIEISIPPCFGERTLDESRNTYSRRTRGKGTTNTNRRLPLGYVLPRLRFFSRNCVVKQISDVWAKNSHKFVMF